MILLPSRRRIDNLKNFFRSLKETNATSPGIVIIDTKDYLDNCGAYLNLETMYFPDNWRLYVSKSETMGDKIRELWGLYSDQDWVGILNDDHYCLTNEWDKKLIAQLTGKNFISCGDNWVANQGNSLPAGATIWSGDLIRAVGYMFPPKLQHCFIDNIWAALGMATGSWIKDLSVVVEHRHVDKGDAAPDETHKKMQNFFHTDGPIYIEWLKNDYANAVLAIMELQRGPPRI